MSSISQYYIITIQRSLYSYGFELKDEGKSYRNYAMVSKITNDVAGVKGLRVGNKVVSINGEDVHGKDYIYLRNIIRNSVDDCVKLKILKEDDIQMIISLPQQPTQPKQSFEKTFIPSSSILEKIRIFQDRNRNCLRKNFTRLSNSCDCINKCGYNSHILEIERSRNIKRASSVSLKNCMQNVSSSESDSEIEESQSISQNPFCDDSISISQPCVNFQSPSNVVLVIDSKCTEHIETRVSLTSNNSVFEFMSEPFDDGPILNSDIPKLEMPKYHILELQNTKNIQPPVLALSGSPSNYCSTTGFGELSPDFINSKSHSTNNIFEDATIGWRERLNENKDFVEFGSMKNISRSIKINFFGDKEISNRSSFVTYAPIKLQIIQFCNKGKSKGWKDYSIEPEFNGVRFKKRYMVTFKHRKNYFTVGLDHINTFEVDFSLRRQKMSSSCDQSIEQSSLRYSLAAFNNNIQIKFQYNPNFFQDNVSSKKAYEIYVKIIDSFKAATNKSFHSMHIQSLSQCNANSSVFENERNLAKTREFASSIQDLYITDYHHSPKNSYKITSKSSAESIGATTLELSQTSPKNIFKQTMGKIKPDKKSKVTETGTSAELEEFRKQLEGCQSLLELDSLGDNGTNFNRYIYEVPRMNTAPKIPMIIYLCTEVIECVGMKVEGIYRISGNQRVMRILSTTLNKSMNDIDTHLPEWNNVHALCGILKLFLRKLKQYLIPADLSRVLAYSCKGVDCENAHSLSKTLMDFRYHLSSYQISFPRGSTGNKSDHVECHWRSLKHILKHLSNVVSFGDFNKMDEHAISICFNPVIMESWQNNNIDIKGDNEIMVKALELILVHQDWLFSNWRSKMEYSGNSELVEDAQKYATDFVYRKYDFNIKLDEEEEYPDNTVVDVNLMVERIITQCTMTFEEKRVLERRHSSHTTGQRPVILRDEVDMGENSSINRRNSQTADALDLFTCANWMKHFATVQTISEGQERNSTYSPSKDPHLELFEQLIAEEHVLVPRMPRDVAHGRASGD